MGFIWVAQSLSVTSITEAVVRYLEMRLITTAGLYLYANIHTNRVASLLRLFAFGNSIQTIKPQAVRDRRPVKDSDWVLTCSGEASVPCDPEDQVSSVRHTTLTCASLNCLICLWCDYHEHALECARCSSLMILILCGWIVLLLQCNCIRLCFYNSIVFL